MFVKKLLDCPELIAGDNTILRELLHPDKQPLELRYSFADATLPVGKTSQLHSLKTSEVYYILSGKGESVYSSQCKAICSHCRPSLA